MNKFKRIIIFVCVVLFCFTLLMPKVYAAGTPLLGGQQFGALIASGLLSLNILANTALQSQPIQKLWDWCSAPTAEDRINYLFPNTAGIISDYMNAATIKVDQGIVTIDGVEYDELWIAPGTFTDGLKTNLFDFKTKWSILSGQTGTLATGAGNINGNPIYNVNGVLRTPGVEIQWGDGEQTYNDFGCNLLLEQPYSSTQRFIDISSSLESKRKAERKSNSPFRWYLYRNGDYFNADIRNKDDIVINGLQVKVYPYSEFVDEPFEFNYISGIVPANESEIPEEYGLSLKIPHEQLQTFYNTYPQYNVDNSVINIQQDQVDIDELTQAIFDQIQSMEDIKAEWTSGEEPEPPVPVDPIDNIDENVQSINQYQQNMNQQVNHMHQDVEAIHQTQQQQQQIQEQIQQTQQDIAETSESIDDTLKDIKDSIQPGEITEKTFDLRELFPFCIPFDIYHLLQKFDGSPTAPHVQLPIVIPSIGFSYTMDLDFSAWDSVAAAMRTVELIVYALGLAWATSKVIKW